MVTRTRRMTLEEFLALPEEKPYLELIDGEVQRKPVGKNKHANAQGELIYLLRAYSRTHGGKALVEGGVTIVGDNRNFRVPDVSYFGPDQALDLDHAYASEAPRLAVEVRSEGQSLRALRERLAFFREHGSQATLLVDPDARTVEVHDGDRTWTATAEDVVTLESVPDFSFRVADLFI
jgi:Uma2 family endonuclease